MLSESPVQVDRKSVTIGTEIYFGDDLSCLFIRPRKNNYKSTIGVVAATGVIGHRINYTRPYMSPGFTYPDVSVFSSEILKEEGKGYKAAGFFGNDWTVKNGEFIFIN